jgi:hypothetical protein
MSTEDTRGSSVVRLFAASVTSACGIVMPGDASDELLKAFCSSGGYQDFWFLGDCALDRTLHSQWQHWRWGHFGFRHKRDPRARARPWKARRMEMAELKISVTFTEFDGEKKVESLPHTLVVVADGRPPKSVKLGSRVPVYAGKEYGMQYVDVGTGIDCQASQPKDNKFDIKLILERSWVDGNVSVAVDPATSVQSSGNSRTDLAAIQIRKLLSDFGRRQPVSEQVGSLSGLLTMTRYSHCLRTRLENDMLPFHRFSNRKEWIRRED